MWIRRTLPPTAAPLSWREIMEGLHGWFSEARATERIEKELSDYFDVPDCWLVSSGKAALTLILKAMHSLSPERTSVLIPAYTCYSVASCVVKAGLSVALGDIDPRTLDFDYSRLESMIESNHRATLCLVVNHLLGRPADLDRCLSLARSKGIWVVEDAAQAMGIVCQGKPAGARGDAGFVSLGRGKVICAVEGGIILSRNQDLAAALHREYRQLPAYKVHEKTSLLAKAIALVCFLRPSLYWLPEHLPFLKLGQTEFSTQFSLKRMSGFQCGLMRRWKSKMVRLNQARLERAHLYHQLLGHRLPAAAIPSNLPTTTLPTTHEDKSAHEDELDVPHFPLIDEEGENNHHPHPASPATGDPCIKGEGNSGCPHIRWGTSDDESAHLPSLRFPLIVENAKQRDHLYEQARRQGLGISRMYPDSIDSIAQLQGQVIRGNYPAASKLAQTLLTLPTHPLILPKDQERIIRLVTASL